MEQERSFCTMLFEDQVKIWINAKIKLAVFDKPVIHYNQKTQPSQCGIRGISVSVESTDEDYIINRMMGMPMQTEDEEADMQSASELFVQDVPIEKVIEIWNLTGEVRFADTHALNHSYEVARNYLTELEERQKYSVNFAGVPEEDIEKIREYVEGIRYVFESMQGDLHFDLALSELLESATFSNLFDNKKGDNQGLLVTRGQHQEDLHSSVVSHGHSAFGFNRD